MSRLLVHVEGETEETFVNEILSPHLYSLGYEMVGARLLGNARQRQLRGGIKPWSVVRRDIVRHLREDSGSIATTMVDYYGLPHAGNEAWPGKVAATMRPFTQKASTVETAIHNDISAEIGTSFNARRFVAFVVMHEFEGLLFSDCAAFARGVARPELQPQLLAIRNQFATPEEINDSPATHPSRRVLNLMPKYQKPLHGNVAAIKIGLGTIRGACPHFADWLDRLEASAK